MGRSRGIVEGGGMAAVLDPREDRFAMPGPTERFSDVNPAAGTGNNVGVAGREVGVGIELLVVVLPAESLDCGRRMPVCIVL